MCVDRDDDGDTDSQRSRPIAPDPVCHLRSAPPLLTDAEQRVLRMKTTQHMVTMRESSHPES